MVEERKSTGYKKIVLLTLLLLFCLYTTLIYTNGTKNSAPTLELSVGAVRGKMLWQKYNCTACHQLYGLGGYLGPDLTNVISAKGKGAHYARAMMNSGIGQMPGFNLSETELNDLIAFLEQVDKSGAFPNKNTEMTWYGSFNIKQTSK